MSAHTTYLSQKSFGGLDALRCLSIVAVVWHHSAPFTDSLPLTSRGFLGVDLFFVISGYLIVTLLLREKARNGYIAIKAFYIRRTLRIFPVYYGLVLALALYYSFVNAGSEIGQEFLDDLWIYLTYTGNLFIIGWSVVWSLAAEEQFYLVWPHVERRLTQWIVPILLIAIGLNQFFNFPSTRSAIADWLNYPGLVDLAIAQVTFTPILLGVALAHLMHNRTSFDRLSAVVLPKYASMFWLIALIALVSVPNDNISGLHRLSIHLVMVVFLGSCVIREDHFLMPLLRVPLVVRIGVVSYGVYLFHTHVLVVTEKLLEKFDLHFSLAPFFIGLVLSVIVAELSFRFYEKRFLVLKQRFSKT